MEREESIFPQIDLFPRATKVARFIFGSTDAEVAYPSEHRRIPEPSDGEAMETYHQPRLDGWDDCGTYINRSDY